MPENVAAVTPDDAFCEKIVVQSIIDVQSHRIAAHIASNVCVDRLRTFSTASTAKLTGAALSRVRVERRVRSHRQAARRD